MDAIAAITGLLRSAGEVSRILGPYVAAFEKQLLRVAVQLHSEVQSTKLFLAALQGIIQSQASLPAQRAAIIKVDHLVAILTDGVLVFSELDAVVSSIRPLDKHNYSSGSGHQAPPHLLEDVQRISNQASLQSLLPRLEAFRISLRLMVDTLQADTEERAAAHVEELDGRVRIILHDNPSLSAYLASADELRDDDETVRPSAEAGSSRQPQQPFRNLQSTIKNILSRRSSPRDTSSRVPIPTSSPFASLGLSEISSPYLVIIPVQRLEIRNPEQYEFRSATSPSSSPAKEAVIPVPVSVRTKYGFSNIPYFQPDKYIYHDCFVIKAQLGQVPRLKRFLEYPWPPLDEESSYSQVLMEMHVLRRLFRSGGLQVITQMIEMVSKIVQEDNENVGHTRLCGFEDAFEEWRKDPQPIYVREYEGKSKPVDLLAREVSFFTIACLEFPDLGSVMKVKGSTKWLFTTKDICQDDYKGFVKVIGVIKTVLDRLTSRGMLKNVNPWAIREAEQEGAGELDNEGLPQDDPPAYESGDEEGQDGLSEKIVFKEK